MAQKDEPFTKDRAETMEQLKQKLEHLDRRLDDIDSTVSAIAERAMSRPVTLTVACPGCGKIIEIAIVGNGKMVRQP
ncbi:MAG: hypothetical protein WC333_05940 [Dehalococcoidia bacterium]